MTQEKINEILSTELGQQIPFLYVTSDDKFFIRYEDAAKYRNDLLFKNFDDIIDSKIEKWYPERRNKITPEKGYKKTKFLLPFNSISDLSEAYTKLLAYHKLASDNAIKLLKEKEIPYEIVEPYRIEVNIEDIPQGINLSELFSKDAELRKEVYSSVGVLQVS